MGLGAKVADQSAKQLSWNNIGDIFEITLANQTEINRVKLDKIFECPLG